MILYYRTYYVFTTFAIHFAGNCNVITKSVHSDNIVKQSEEIRNGTFNTYNRDDNRTNNFSNARC